MARDEYRPTETFSVEAEAADYSEAPGVQNYRRSLRLAPQFLRTCSVRPRPAAGIRLACGSLCSAPPPEAHTTMLRLSREQRRTLADKLPDAANLALGALVFGQFLQERPFSPVLAATGVGVWLALLAWALFLGRRHRD
jgi:hypothetical protein